MPVPEEYFVLDKNLLYCGNIDVANVINIVYAGIAKADIIQIIVVDFGLSSIFGNDNSINGRKIRAELCIDTAIAIIKNVFNGFLSNANEIANKMNASAKNCLDIFIVAIKIIDANIKDEII